jgi:hypothetical protein
MKRHNEVKAKLRECDISEECASSRADKTTTSKMKRENKPLDLQTWSLLMTTAELVLGEKVLLK